jgi:DeoR/GlpR family transcriptional regulator of sugar metabolism
MSIINKQQPAEWLKEERHAFLVDCLRNEGKLVASELSERLGVSEDTIRRDLRELAEQHKLQRVHGGALPRSPVATSYAVRQKQSITEKNAIARAAAKLIQDGQLVFMDGGTTTVQVAQYLAPDLRATIVTNSPPLAIALAGHERIDAILLGGRLYKDALVTIGAATSEELQSFRADLCLLGVCSLHPEVGLSIEDYEEGQIKRAMIANSAEVAGLVAIEKLGTAMRYVVAPARALTYLVTENGATEQQVAPYRKLRINVILC